MHSLSSGRSPWAHGLLYRGVALLCLLLVLFAGAAHLLHTHADTETGSTTCSLCVVAHVAATPVPVLGPPVPFELLVRIRPPVPALVSSKVLSFHLYVRPPPAPDTHA